MTIEAADANGPQTVAEHAVQPRILEWTVPRWRIAHNWRRAADTVFGRGPVIRIVGTSLLVGVVICLAAKLAVPQLRLGQVWFALLFIPGIFAQLGVYILVHIAIRGQVKITDDSVQYSHTNGKWRTTISEIESAKLVVYSAEHLVLKLKPANKREASIALPPTTDLRLLTSILPGIDVIDKRAAFAAARAIVLSCRVRPPIRTRNCDG